MSGVEMEEQNRRDELEAEMSRFEQEIAGHPIPRPGPAGNPIPRAVIGTNTFNIASKAILKAEPTRPTPLPDASRNHFVPRSITRPPSVQPPSMLQPTNLNHPNLHIRPVNAGPMNRGPPRPHMQHPMQHHVQAPPNQLPPPPMPPSMPMVGGMPPMAHQMGPNPGGLVMGQVMGPVGMPMVPVPMPMGMPNMPTVGPTPVPMMTAEEQREWESTYSQGAAEGKEKKKAKEKKFIRVAGDSVWEDSSLAEWDTDDFRVFCGDLGNEVTDEALNRAFAKYPSLLKAKVVRDKKTQKSKGFGFLSFKDPNDFVKAMREMNGKYIGNRPIKLRKSTWRDRNIEVVKKKSKEKKRLGYR